MSRWIVKCPPVARMQAWKHLCHWSMPPPIMLISSVDPKFSLSSRFSCNKNSSQVVEVRWVTLQVHVFRCEKAASVEWLYIAAVPRSNTAGQSRVWTADAVSVLLHSVLVHVEARGTLEEAHAAARARRQRPQVSVVSVPHDAQQSSHQTSASAAFTGRHSASVHCDRLYVHR